jgi:hypothetical protein
MSLAPHTSRPKDIELRKFLKKKLLIAAPLCFSLVLLLDLSGITDGGFPSNWGQALIQVTANIFQTAFLLIVTYFVLIYVFRRFPRKDKI